MATIHNKKDKDIEILLRDFRKEVEKEDILGEQKRRRYFISNSRINHERNKKFKYKQRRRKISLKRNKHVD